MGRPLIDIKGQRFGRLIPTRHIYKTSLWVCRCDCGKTHIAAGNSLRIGHVSSCGCLNSELSAKRTYVHGHYGTPEYHAWSSAKGRCFNRENFVYRHYGGRGITMCSEWRDSFKKFLSHVGKRPSRKHSLDRINVNGNYEPGNVRWATKIQQMNNMRNSSRITYKGKTRTAPQWARILKINYSALWARIDKGWDIQRIFTTPYK